MTCLARLCHDPSGAVRKNEQRAAQQFKGGAGDFVLKKSACKADLDALKFAGADNIFDLLEVGVLGAQDDAEDGMIMQRS